LEITKRITIPIRTKTGVYALQMQLEFKNTSKVALKRPAYL